MAGAEVTDDDTTALDDAARRRGRALFGGIVRDQWRGLAVGVGAGIAWTLAKISVPMLVRMAIDRGIEADDTQALMRWVFALLVAAVVAADLHRAAALPRVQAVASGRGPRCVTVCTRRSCASSSSTTTACRPAS